MKDKVAFMQKVDSVGFEGEFALAFVTAFVTAFVFMIAGAEQAICVGVSAFAFVFVFVFSGNLKNNDRFIGLLIRIIDLTKNRKVRELKVAIPSRYKLLKLSEVLFSARTQKEVFEVTMADWDDEIYTALKKDKDANLSMINVRHTYAFLAAMWQKSPIGDLIEFISKIAK